MSFINTCMKFLSKLCPSFTYSPFSNQSTEIHESNYQLKFNLFIPKLMLYDLYTMVVITAILIIAYRVVVVRRLIAHNVKLEQLSWFSIIIKLWLKPAAAWTEVFLNTDYESPHKIGSKCSPGKISLQSRNMTRPYWESKSRIKLQNHIVPMSVPFSNFYHFGWFFTRNQLLSQL